MTYPQNDLKSTPGSPNMSGQIALIRFRRGFVAFHEIS